MLTTNHPESDDKALAAADYEEAGAIAQLIRRAIIMNPDEFSRSGAVIDSIYSRAAVMNAIDFQDNAIRSCTALKPKPSKRRGKKTGSKSPANSFEETRRALDFDKAWSALTAHWPATWVTFGEPIENTKLTCNDPAVRFQACWSTTLSKVMALDGADPEPCPEVYQFLILYWVLNDDHADNVTPRVTEFQDWPFRANDKDADGDVDARDEGLRLLWLVGEKPRTRLAARRALLDLDVISIANRLTRRFSSLLEPGSAASDQLQGSFSVATVLENLEVSTSTLSKYAKQAGVQTPQRGKRNHRYSGDELRRILQKMVNVVSNRELKGRCATVLDDLLKSNLNPTKIQKSSGNPKP